MTGSKIFRICRGQVVFRIVPPRIGVNNGIDVAGDGFFLPGGCFFRIQNTYLGNSIPKGGRDMRTGLFRR